MKIKQVTIYHVRMPLVSPFETSFGRQETRDCLLVQVRADGLTGYGECVADQHPLYGSEYVVTAWNVLKDYLVPALLEEDASMPEGFLRRVRDVRGHRMAKAGAEMALWDLIGQRAGRSLRDLLGGRQDRVPVGVSVGLQESAEKLVDVVAGYLDDGYRRIKIKIKPGRDVDDATAVRQNFPDLRLQVDANSAYSLDTAQVLAPLDDLRLLMIEQPLADDDMWDHHKLQQKFNTPLCLDESIRSPRHARQAIEMEACRVINIKVGRVGGLSQAVAIHDHCDARGIPVWCGGMLETGVGRAANLALASLRGFTLPGDISATSRYYQEDITRERFELNADSTITVPTGPGLGIRISEQALARYSLASLTLP